MKNKSLEEHYQNTRGAMLRKNKEELPWAKADLKLKQTQWDSELTGKINDDAKFVDGINYIIPKLGAEELWENNRKYKILSEGMEDVAGIWFGYDTKTVIRDSLKYVRKLEEENDRLKKKIIDLEEKNQDYLDATGDAVSTLCLRDEKIERLRKALEILEDTAKGVPYVNSSYIINIAQEALREKE